MSSIITNAGLAKINNFESPADPIRVVYFAVGDGAGSNYTPTGAEASLRNEQWRGAPTDEWPDTERHGHWYEVAIPHDVGGFWVREYGLYDDTGALVVIGSIDPFFKMRDSGGEGQEVVFRVRVVVSNADIYLS